MLCATNAELLPFQVIVNVQLLELCILAIMLVSNMFRWSFLIALFLPHSSLGDPRLKVLKI